MENRNSETGLNINLSAPELLEVAVMLERTSADFYRLLADQAEPGALRDFFLGLIGMEIQHERKMLDLLATLSEPATEKRAFDEDFTGREYFLNLRSLAIKRLFPEGFELFEMMDRVKAPAEALPVALELEEKSLRLYRLLSRFQLSTEGRLVVEHVTREEEEHLSEVKKMYGRFSK